MADEEKPKDEPEVESQSELDAKESFRKGMGLLWRAARTAADEIKREVEKGGVKDSLKQAGRELEAAAEHAAKTLEGMLQRIGPGEPKPDYTDTWPPDQKAKQVDADIPKDGGTDEKGERRDVRIQLDDD